MAKFFVDVNLSVNIGVNVEAETIDNAKVFAEENVTNMLNELKDAYVGISAIETVRVNEEK